MNTANNYCRALGAIAICLTTSQLSAKTDDLASTLQKARMIDTIMNAEYKKLEIEPLAIVDDGTFMRRAYLNIIGRIPTSHEAKQFIADKSPGKRSKLIESLISSPGHKSKMFLFWAELLRLNTAKEKHGLGWHVWLKKSVAENKPYDKMVYEMLSAEGHAAKNPAVGYYLRDRGMVLDNVSNTMQVFLGTQIGCAQCHDHPFEDTTQKEYYQLAAFAGGFEYKSKDAFMKLKEVGTHLAKENGDFAKALEMNANRKKRKRNNAASIVKRYAKQNSTLFKYFGRNALLDNPSKTLRLPHDYQYNDGKPGDIVHPKTLFGKMPELHGNGSRREVFAKWLTSPENPQFTKVIANRLWAHAFNYGLAEPLDNWTDRTKVAHENVLKFLTEEMKSNGYDVLQTLRLIYHTKLFQRTVTSEEVEQGKVFHFAGPMLRRMSAEEMHDSLITLESGKLDSHSNEGQELAWKKYETYIKTLLELPPAQVVELNKKAVATEKARTAKQSQVRKLRLEAEKAKGEGNLAKARQLQIEIRKVYQKAAIDKKYNKKTPAMGELENMMMMTGGRVIRTKKNKRLRASEQPFPARAGTFVREFGGSDGELSNNSHELASVPQALTLLNGREISMVTDTKGSLPFKLKSAATPKAKLEVLYLSIYSRYPTENEVAKYSKYMTSTTQTTVLTKAMINSKTFLFIQ